MLINEVRTRGGVVAAGTGALLHGAGAAPSGEWGMTRLTPHRPEPSLEYVIVEIDSDSGITGVGEACTDIGFFGEPLGGGAERHRPVPRSQAAGQGSVRPRATAVRDRLPPATPAPSPGIDLGAARPARQGPGRSRVQPDRRQPAAAGARV